MENMSYIDFIESQKDAIKGFEQEGFFWRNGYEPSFLDMVAKANADFKTVIKNLPETLDRNAVRSIFHSEKDLYKGFVACMLWGGINAKRCAKGHKGDLKTTDAYRAFTFPKGDFDDGKRGIVSRLTSVKQFLDEGKTGAAFDSMNNGNENHIPGIGVSFFTKLLYFLAPDTVDPRPLIYDKWSTYIHCALLIDDRKKNARDYYKSVNKEGILSKVKSEVVLYKDYLEVMKETAANNNIPDVSRLEAFLFGFALNGTGHREEKNRRARLKEHVLKYFGKRNNRSQDGIYKLSKEDNVPYRKNVDFVKKYKIVHQGVIFYAFVGKDTKKIYCEVLSPKGTCPKIDEIVAKGLTVKGGKKPYYIKEFKKNQQEEALVLLEQIKVLFT